MAERKDSRGPTTSDDHKQPPDDIDYRAEGDDPGREKKDPTDDGYDEAAHNGRSRYAVGEGRGGVFGTTGGGSYNGGFQVIERPTPFDRSGEETTETDRGTKGRDEGEGFDQVNLDPQEHR
jgi:hypothetical protein